MRSSGTYRFRTVLIWVLLSELLFFIAVGLLFLWLIPSIENLSVQRMDWLPYLMASSLLALLFLRAMRSKAMAMASYSQAASGALLAPAISTGRHILHFILWRWAIALIILAIMNPRLGKKEVDVNYSGVDIMVCLDVSNSMLADDISPSRLVKSKRAISQLLDELHGDRVGLIVFAGDAYVQLPITTDYAAAEMFLPGISPELVPTQGTAIGAAIDLAMKSFGEEPQASRTIIVISDGENHQDDAMLAAQRAAEQGVSVHAIGMGSADGAPIPLVQGRRKIGYKKDKQGETVISKLDEEMLRQVAAAGHGVFVRASNTGSGLEAVLEELEAMEDNEFGKEQYADHEDRFQLFLLLAIFLIMIESLLPYKRSKWLKRMDIFD